MALTKDSAARAPALRNLAVALAAIAVLIWSMSGGAAAETAYSFDVTPGKLPKTVVPPMPGSGSTATGGADAHRRTGWQPACRSAN